MTKVTGTDLKSATPEQLVTLSSTIALELVKGLARAKVSFAQAQTWATNKSMPQRAARKIAQELGYEIFTPDPRLVAEQALWAKLGIALSVDELNLPEIPAGFTEIAIRPAGVTNVQLFALIKQEREKRGESAWKYHGNLDDIKEEQHRPSGTYVFAYRPDSEPDALHLGKSYNVAIAEKLTFLTLSERLIAELRAIILGKYFDVKGLTITSSLASDGSAFIVYWYSSYRKSDVGGCDRSCAGPAHGPRQAVFA